MILLVTGGSGSGKSAFAEDQVLKLPGRPRIYIATMFPYDEESKKRVVRHKNLRAGKEFETIERYLSHGELGIPSGSVVLLECMSNLVANEMFMEGGAGTDTVRKVTEGVRHIAAQAAHLVIVTNEIFSEAYHYEGDTERYQSYLGQINQAVAQLADRVYEVVYGIPFCLKGPECKAAVPVRRDYEEAKGGDLS